MEYFRSKFFKLSALSEARNGYKMIVETWRPEETYELGKKMG